VATARMTAAWHGGLAPACSPSQRAPLLLDCCSNGLSHGSPAHLLQPHKASMTSHQMRSAGGPPIVSSVVLYVASLCYKAKRDFAFLLAGSLSY